MANATAMQMFGWKGKSVNYKGRIKGISINYVLKKGTPGKTIV